MAEKLDLTIRPEYLPADENLLELYSKPEPPPMQIAPDGLGGWVIIPRRWKAEKGGKPYFGLEFRREF